MDDCEGVGQVLRSGRGVVVVRDDQVHARGAGRRGRLDRRHAAIDGDNDPGTLIGKLGHGGGVQAVPFLQPVRNVSLDWGVRVNEAERVEQDRRRGDPIHVVVAVDHDRLTGREGIEQSSGGPVQVRDERGIMQVQQRRLDERPHALGLDQAAAGQDSLEQRSVRRHGHRGPGLPELGQTTAVGARRRHSVAGSS
jgi:hypothetical protein